jgi:hypothetical protein
MKFVMFAGVLVMFILATADVGVSFHLMLRETNIFVQGNSKTLLTKAYPKFLLHVTNKWVVQLSSTFSSMLLTVILLRQLNRRYSPRE